MTEVEWLACEDDVRGMLLHLADRDLLLSRKLHLFACACVRRVWPHLANDRDRVAIEVVERFADQQASHAELSAANVGTHAAYDVAQEDGWYAAWYGSGRAIDFAVGKKKSERKEQVKLLRDILGNPFRRASLFSAWLTWHDGLILKMARQMYETRDFTEMPIFADALEEASCTNADILNHCRQPGEHVRGCWIIDLILGKE